VDEQYANLLTRIIGFQLVSDSDPFYSRLSLNEKLLKSRELNDEAVTGLGWDGMTGEKPKGIGMTGEKPTGDDVQVVQELMAESSNTGIIRSKRTRPSHLGSLQTVVIWNKSQLNVLLVRPTKVVLDSDFGCGKTLLMKSFALQLANWLDQDSSSSEVEVYFVSLSAARTQVICSESDLF
jgi:hypothetical protein